jgi:ribosomal-protein-alanine N-acetyltransferase
VTLDVDPALRRCGLGGRLLGEAERVSALAGAAAMWLHVFEGNAAAIALYESAGYVALERTPDYYGTGRGAVTYGRRLTP